MFVGGFLYASGEVTYTQLAGATDPLSYSWVWAVQGLGILLLGFGILFAFVGLSRGWPTVGGGIAFFGTVLMACGDAAYALYRGHVSSMDLLWTDTADALGFLFLAIGLAVAFAGMSVLLPHGPPDAFDRGRW